MITSGLLRTQKVAIATLLKSKGIDLAAFDLTDTEKQFSIIHRETGYYLRITHKPSGWNYKIQCAPGKEKISADTLTDRWDSVLNFVNSWVENLERELRTVDLWNQPFAAATEIRMVSGASAPDSQFTTDEKLTIADGLREIREYLVSSRELVQPQLAFIDAK